MPLWLSIVLLIIAIGAVLKILKFATKTLLIAALIVLISSSGITLTTLGKAKDAIYTNVPITFEMTSSVDNYTITPKYNKPIFSMTLSDFSKPDEVIIRYNPKYDKKEILKKLNLKWNELQCPSIKMDTIMHFIVSQPLTNYFHFYN